METEPVQIQTESRAECELGELYEKHHKDMYKVAKAKLQDRMLAENAVHNVFVGLLQPGKPPNTFGKNPQAYLFHCLGHEIARVARDRKNAGMTYVEDESIQYVNTSKAAGVPAPSHVPEYDEETLQRLRRALKTLDAETLSMLTLRYDGGYSNRDIAKMTGGTMFGVATALYRGRRKVEKLVVNPGEVQ